MKENCQKCGLFNNQMPLCDNVKEADIIWVGLSAKKVSDIEIFTPLSSDTCSGLLINKIETGLGVFKFFKSNLVKCLPLDEKCKLRYPSKNEMHYCVDNLYDEIKKMRPRIVFLLGRHVSDFVLKQKIQFDHQYDYGVYKFDEILFIPIHHPSFIHVYKKKEIDTYVYKVQNLILALMNKNEEQIKLAFKTA